MAWCASPYDWSEIIGIQWYSSQWELEWFNSKFS